MGRVVTGLQSKAVTAHEIINNNWQWPEYKSNNKYYTATRISAINTMICNCYIINTAEGTVYHPHESNPKIIKKIRGKKGWNIQYMSTCPDGPARNSGFGKTAFSASTLDGTATTESMLMCVPYGTMHIWHKGDAENKTRLNLPSVGRKELRVCPQCGRYDLDMPSHYSYARNSIRGFYIWCDCGLYLHTDAYDLGCRADDKEAEYAVVAERTIRIWNNIRVDPDDYRKQYSDDLTMIGEVVELADDIAIVK
ncbi:MAG: hypothetical protein IJJ29_02240, partial [Solobacterium sp.]|nr:hypothetical protein [Solobacterium sp.]